jgi:hypothetical protein
VPHAADLRHDEPSDEVPWEDIDSELSVSTREVCFGYGSWARAMAVIRAARRTSGVPAGPLRFGPP